jgi:hypothetical protein
VGEIPKALMVLLEPLQKAHFYHERSALLLYNGFSLDHLLLTLVVWTAGLEPAPC